MTYNITCSTDDNYLQHCMAMLCSVFENNKGEKICVHMMVDDSLSEKSRKLISDLAERYANCVCFYDVDPHLVAGFDVSSAVYNGKKRFPMIVYYRLLLQIYLPEDIERILYLDCDVIVLTYLRDLFQLNLEGYGVAAVRDSSPFDDTHRKKMEIGLQHITFCSGIMMINMKYWRLIDAYRQFVDYFRRSNGTVYLPDQDALNAVFRDKWYMLPYKWGKTPLSIAPIDRFQKDFDVEDYVLKPCIIHFSSSIKPWMEVWQPEKHYYRHYLRLSGFSCPTEITLNAESKKNAYIVIIRYIISFYIRPCVPDIFELLIKDIVNVFVMIISLIKGPQSFKSFLLKRWKDKYQM